MLEAGTPASRECHDIGYPCLDIFNNEERSCEPSLLVLVSHTRNTRLKFEINFEQGGNNGCQVRPLEALFCVDDDDGCNDHFCAC